MQGDVSPAPSCKVKVGLRVLQSSYNHYKKLWLQICFFAEAEKKQ